MTVNNRRQGNKWTINELISLQREYELLELTVQEIAEKHQRSETAILYKLESEGLIESWNNARGFVSEDYQNSVSSNKEQVEAEVEECCGGDDDEEYQFIEDAESDDDDISDDESEVEKLTERVWSLETSVGEISSMVKNIYSMLSAKQSNKKRKPLRNTSTASA
jgi:HD superfamily phosphohydrolase